MRKINGISLQEYFIEIARLHLEIARKPADPNIYEHHALISMSKAFMFGLYEKEKNCRHCDQNVIACICSRVDKFFEKGV